MKGKKSFILYCDLIHTLEKLPNEKAGELFKHILRYVNDLNPETDDLLIDAVFEQIKQSLKRDLNKYNNIVERNRENGSKGGRPKKPKKPSGLSGNPKKPKKADSDSGSDSVNDNDINNIPSKEEFISYCFSKKSNLSRESISLKYDSWKENGWRDGHDKPIKNWKSKALNIIPYLKEKDENSSPLSSKALN